MTTTTYRCPMCDRTMERNLILFLDHTNQHVIDQIKKEHPEWVESDGVCKPCAEYYKKQLSGQIEENIGPRGRRNRFWLGILMTIFSLGLAFIFKSNGVPKPYFLVLFFPFFAGFLGFIQARQKTCAILAERGVCDMDSGEGKVANLELAKRLKSRGRKILLQSAFAAAFLTALLFLI